MPTQHATRTGMDRRQRALASGQFLEADRRRNLDRRPYVAIQNDGYESKESVSDYYWETFLNPPMRDWERMDGCQRAMSPTNMPIASGGSNVIGRQREKPAFERDSDDSSKMLECSQRRLGAGAGIE